MVAQPAPTNTWRWHPDDELRYYRQLYRRMRAMLPEDIADPSLRASTAAYVDHLLGEIGREIDWRRRAAARGVAIEPSRFAPEFIAELKARVNLDAMVEFDLNSYLGPSSAKGTRRGPCPFCGGDDRSDRFAVTTAEPTDQFFYCFSCGQKGDAITLLMQAYGGSFPLAVERLAAMCGVALPEKPKPTPGDVPGWAPDFVNMAPGR